MPIALDRLRYPCAPRASTSRCVARGSGTPVGGSSTGAPPEPTGAGRCSSAPKDVLSPTFFAASENRTTPYSPSWSVIASDVSPSRAPSAASSSGWEAPSRKLNAEWACSSA